MHNTCLGKFTYQSPECYHCKKLQRSYDCRLNDRYGLGICLYALLVGTFPYKSPSDHDSNASELLKDGMMSFLKKRKLLHLVNEETIELLDDLIVKRLDLSEILNHRYFSSLNVKCSDPPNNLNPSK